MSDKADKTDNEKTERERVFQISANRGRSRHKLRYVESSLSDTGDCRLCVGALSPDDDVTETTETVDDKDKDAADKS